MVLLSSMLLFLAIWAFLVPMGTCVPFQITVYARATECLYEKLEAGESVTFSVFLLSGTVLKTEYSLEGPFASPEVEETLALMEAQTAFAAGNNNNGFTDVANIVRVSDVVDFEHHQPPISDEEAQWERELQAATNFDMDEDKDGFDEETATPEELKQRLEERRKRRSEARRKAQEARRKRLEKQRERQALLKETIRKEGEPFQKTITAKAAGWFRGCIVATPNQVVAEVEFRKSNELGGLDPETGHVYSYDLQEERQEETLLDQDTPSQESMVGAEDFETTRDQLRQLRRAVTEILAKQRQGWNRRTAMDITNQVYSRVSDNPYVQ